MSKMSVSNLYVVLQASFVENAQILCNDRDCPQGLLLHKFFFFFFLKIKLVVFLG